MIASRSVNMARHPRGSYIVMPIAHTRKQRVGAVIHEQENRHKVPKSVLRAVIGRMQFTLHATRGPPHGASRLAQAISAWLMKTRRAPSRHSRDAKVCGHKTTIMHELSTPHSIRPSFAKIRVITRRGQFFSDYLVGSSTEALPNADGISSAWNSAIR